MRFYVARYGVRRVSATLLQHDGKVMCLMRHPTTRSNYLNAEAAMGIPHRLLPYSWLPSIAPRGTEMRFPECSAYSLV